MKKLLYFSPTVQRPCELLSSLGLSLSVVRLSHLNIFLLKHWTKLHHT